MFLYLGVITAKKKLTIRDIALSSKNTTNIQSNVYGPPVSEVEFTRLNILYHLDILSKDIAQEKILGSSIKINTHATPYAKAVVGAQNRIHTYQDKIHTELLNDATVAQQEYYNLKTSIEQELKHALNKTENLLNQLRETVKPEDIKKKLNNTLKNRLKQSLMAAKNNANNNPIKVEETATIINLHQEKADKKIKNNVSAAQLEKISQELMDIANKLISGDLASLKDHFYFKAHPELLRHYIPNNKDTSPKLFKTFLQVYVRKITSNLSQVTRQDEIYTKFMTYLAKLSKAETLSVFAHTRKAKFQQAMKNRGAVVKNNKESLLHQRIKNYLSSKHNL